MAYSCWLAEQMYHLTHINATYVSKYFNVLSQPLSSYPRPLRVLRGTAGPLSLWTESRGIAGSRRFKDGSPKAWCAATWQAIAAPASATRRLGPWLTHWPRAPRPDRGSTPLMPTRASSACAG